MGKLLGAVVLLALVGCGQVDEAPSGCVPCPTPVPTCNAPTRTGAMIPGGSPAMQTCGALTVVYAPTNGAATCWANEPEDWQGPAANGDATVYIACAAATNGQ